MFVGKAGSYPSEVLSDVTLQGRLLALPTNIRLVWRSLQGIKTNTLGYYENL
jgi:hypothetical protein